MGYAIEKHPSQSNVKVALVTGTLAEPAVRRVAEDLAKQLGTEPVVVVLPIEVAALMTVAWIARKLNPDDLGQARRLIVPGYCRGDPAPLARQLGLTVERGPIHVEDLPQMFGHRGSHLADYGRHAIEIIAEINDADRLPPDSLLDQARQLSAAGADLIDLGCPPATDRPPWAGLGQAVTALRSGGLRVSVDSFQVDEVEAACRAGAELVLSVNSSNRKAARQWGTEVVAIPDTPGNLDSLRRTIDDLDHHQVRFRADPILEPIGFGLAASLGRYLAMRREYPQMPMMMGVGNLTEMTEVDSAGVNALLVGFCQELKIASVLTTQVIPWAATSVREIDVARRLMHHAAAHQVAPKHIDGRLVMLRDPALRHHQPEELDQLAARLRDRNIRIFADTDHGQLHAMNRQVHAVGDDPYVLFDKLGIDDPQHAFYLGYEMAKAVTALTLGKNYVQDEPLQWGLLTRSEVSHYERRRRPAADGQAAAGDGRSASEP